MTDLENAEGVRAIADETGNLVAQYDYDAFGTLIYSLNLEPATLSNSYLFHGEYYDNDIGLYFLRARWMAAGISRFITMDEYEGMIEEPASLHKYVFVSNDPVNKADPSGNMFYTPYSLALTIGIIGITHNSVKELWNEIMKVRHRMSEKGIELLVKMEGIRLKAYDDQTGKEIAEWKEGATIGIGHLIRTAEEFERYRGGISKEEAKEIFKEDLERYEEGVNELLKVYQKQNQFDALVMLGYNIGIEKGLPTSPVIFMINNRLSKYQNYLSLETAWKSHIISKGKILQGLINRRICEWNVYSKNIYKIW